MKKMTTKDILAESFLEIAAVKNINKITISDIVKNCGLSPVTFYRHFQDKYDLIAWIYGKKNFEVLGNPLDHPYKWISYYKENREILLNLIENTSGSESFLKTLAEIHVNNMESRIIAKYGRDTVTREIQRKLFLYISGVNMLVYIWLKGLIAATVDEIVDTTQETLPKSVIHLLSPISWQQKE